MLLVPEWFQPQRLRKADTPFLPAQSHYPNIRISPPGSHQEGQLLCEAYQPKFVFQTHGFIKDMVEVNTRGKLNLS